jgi:hypothetical protein
MMLPVMLYAACDAPYLSEHMPLSVMHPVFELSTCLHLAMMMKYCSIGFFGDNYNFW